MRKKGKEIVKKKQKERFETLPIFAPGVQLKLEPGMELDSSPKNLKLFYNLAQRCAEIQREIDNLNKQQKKKKKEITKIAKANNGLRGIISEEDNFNLTVFPSEKTTWNREMLKESMGLVYPMAVNETLTVSISIPSTLIPGKKRAPIREEAIEKAIRKSLINLGIPKKDLVKIIHKEKKISVDEERLNEMISLNQVKLLPKTKKSKITWKVRIGLLKS